jgi:hypothetical protein
LGTRHDRTEQFAATGIIQRQQPAAQTVHQAPTGSLQCQFIMDGVVVNIVSEFGNYLIHSAVHLCEELMKSVGLIESVKS